MKKKYLIVLTVLFAVVFYSCSVVQQMTNISRLKYKLDNVSDFKISGVSLSNKKSISDLSILEGANLLSTVTRKSLPTTFNLNVLAQNPNDGGGYASSQNDVDIVDFKWRLFIDNVETVAGNIANPIKVPGKGESTRFGLTISLDLMKYFDNKGYDGIVNLALKLGGYNSKPSSIKLRVQPTIKTMLGNMQYPNELEIIDTEFR